MARRRKKGGVLYKLAPDGTYTVLHSFTQDSDVNTHPHFDRKTGDLYGIASGAGHHYGYVFRLTADGVYSVLYRFAGGNDGSRPSASVVIDASGNIFGTTAAGGPRDCGTVFKITPMGQKSVLYAFRGAHNGVPLGDLVLDNEGNLFGTVHGPSRGIRGALFKLSQDGKLTFLHHFTRGDPAGNGPSGHLVMTKSGKIYGATIFTIYEYSPDGSIKALPEAPRGYFYPAVIRDERGNLYSASYHTVFELVK